MVQLESDQAQTQNKPRRRRREYKRKNAGELSYFIGQGCESARYLRCQSGGHLNFKYSGRDISLSACDQYFATLGEAQIDVLRM